MSDPTAVNSVQGVKSVSLTHMHGDARVVQSCVSVRPDLLAFLASCVQIDTVLIVTLFLNFLLCSAELFILFQTEQSLSQLHGKF